MPCAAIWQSLLPAVVKADWFIFKTSIGDEDMKVLVTGGAGFIGSHLMRLLLAKGCEAVALDNLSTGLRENMPAGAELIESDICDP